MFNLTSCFQGKATATNEELAIVFEEHVSYDLDLPEFGYVLVNNSSFKRRGINYTIFLMEYESTEPYLLPGNSLSLSVIRCFICFVCLLLFCLVLGAL